MDNLFFYWFILPTAAKLSLVFVFSLLIGSFFNVVIYRLPLMMERDWQTQAREILLLPVQPVEKINLWLPRSHCPKCQHQLRFWENIPVVSYVVQCGKCRHCGGLISLVYPFVELITAVLATFVFWYFGMDFHGVLAMVFVYALIVLAAIDIKHQLLPDIITLPLMWLGILISYFSFFIRLETAVLGVIVAYSSLWLAAVLFKWLFKKDGMGLGDAKLLAAIFAWVNIEYLPAVLIIASVTGLVVTVIQRLISGAQLMNNPLPFGPYLALGGLIAFLYGGYINHLLGLTLQY